MTRLNLRVCLLFLFVGELISSANASHLSRRRTRYRWPSSYRWPYDKTTQASLKDNTPLLATRMWPRMWLDDNKESTTILDYQNFRATTTYSDDSEDTTLPPNIFDAPDESSEDNQIGTDDISEPFYVTNSNLNAEGECVCHIQSPEIIQCTTMANDVKINILQTQIDHISDHAAQLNTSLHRQREEISTALDTLQRIEAGQLFVTPPEFEQLRTNVMAFENLLSGPLSINFESNVSASSLQSEISNMNIKLDQLQKAEYADKYQMLAEIENLKQRLKEHETEVDECQSVHFWNETSNEDTCSALVNVNGPYTIRELNSVKGAWFRDPIRDQDKVFVLTLASSSRYGSYIEVYQTVSDFYNGLRNTGISLTYYFEGTGMVAYSGSLFYHVSDSRSSLVYIGKYDLTTRQQMKVAMGSNVQHNNAAPYLGSTYSDIDFAVDESGIWVIYSTSMTPNNLVISKVDPVTLRLTETWNTSFSKRSAGNCFVICGVLYCTNGYNSHSNKINYYFDTKTGKESFLYLPIDNQYLSMQALDYNPYDKKLYGWDNGHQVIYDLTFKKKTSQ